MKKTTLNRTLTLHRETILPLQVLPSSAVATVQGGNATDYIQVSIGAAQLTTMTLVSRVGCGGSQGKHCK